MPRQRNINGKKITHVQQQQIFLDYALSQRNQTQPQQQQQLINPFTNSSFSSFVPQFQQPIQQQPVFQSISQSAPQSIPQFIPQIKQNPISNSTNLFQFSIPNTTLTETSEKLTNEKEKEKEELTKPKKIIINEDENKKIIEKLKEQYLELQKTNTQLTKENKELKDKIESIKLIKENIIKENIIKEDVIKEEEIKEEEKKLKIEINFPTNPDEIFRTLKKFQGKEIRISVSNEQIIIPLTTISIPEGITSLEESPYFFENELVTVYRDGRYNYKGQIQKQEYKLKIIEFEEI